MAPSRKLKTTFARTLAVLGFILLQTRTLQAVPALAQPVQTPEKPAAAATSGADDSDEVVAPDSPRASVESYLLLCGQGRYRDAARYLSIPGAQTKRAADLARRLKAVIDSDFSIDIEALSPKSEGSKSDALPPGHEQIGQPTGTHGKLGPLNLVKKAYPVPEAHWVFSRTTVEQIDGWYDRLEQRWFLEHLPKYLLRSGPCDLPFGSGLLCPSSS